MHMHLRLPEMRAQKLFSCASSSFPFLTDPYGVGFQRRHLITVIRAAARTSLCQTIILILLLLHIQTTCMRWFNFSLICICKCSFKSLAREEHSRTSCQVIRNASRTSLCHTIILILLLILHIYYNIAYIQTTCMWEFDFSLLYICKCWTLHPRYQGCNQNITLPHHHTDFSQPCICNFSLLKLLAREEA